MFPWTAIITVAALITHEEDEVADPLHLGTMTTREIVLAALALVSIPLAVLMFLLVLIWAG
jgi:hypothetical protein